MEEGLAMDALPFRSISRARLMPPCFRACVTCVMHHAIFIARCPPPPLHCTVFSCGFEPKKAFPGGADFCDAAIALAEEAALALQVVRSRLGRPMGASSA